MNFYSFKDENLKRDTEQNNLYNLSKTTVVYNQYTDLLEDVIRREEEMRLDLFCKRLYGTNIYLEEIMKINNILDFWSVKEGDTIKYIDPSVISTLYGKELDTSDKEDKIKQLVDADKNTKTETALPPSVKPSNIEQITLDEKSKKINIIDSFE